jgi:hypothetical protein
MAELEEIKAIHSELMDTAQAVKRIESQVCGSPEAQPTNG